MTNKPLTLEEIEDFLAWCSKLKDTFASCAASASVDQARWEWPTDIQEAAYKPWRPSWADDVPGGDADTHSPLHAEALDKVWEKEMREEVGRLEQKIALGKSLRDAQEREDKLEKEREELWHSSEEYKHWYEITEAKCAKLEKERDELQSRLEVCVKFHQEDKEGLRAQIEYLKSDIESLTSDGDEQIVGLRQSLNKLRAENSELRAEVEQLTHELNE